MNIAKLPFNQHLGLQPPRPNEDALLVLDESPELLNHVGTLHAGALYALAEAGSGRFLVQALGEKSDTIGALLRKASAKYAAPANGRLLAQSKTDPATITDALETVETKGRALVSIEIQLVNEANERVGAFEFTWFLANQES